MKSVLARAKPFLPVSDPLDGTLEHLAQKTNSQQPTGLRDALDPKSAKD